MYNGDSLVANVSWSCDCHAASDTVWLLLVSFHFRCTSKCVGPEHRQHRVFEYATGLCYDTTDSRCHGVLMETPSPAYELVERVPSFWRCTSTMEHVGRSGRFELPYGIQEQCGSRWSSAPQVHVEGAWTLSTLWSGQQHVDCDTTVSV